MNRSSLRERIEARRALLGADRRCTGRRARCSPRAGARRRRSTKSVPVKVMTRNIFLGADLSPALNATSFDEFIAANGDDPARGRRRPTSRCARRAWRPRSPRRSRTWSASRRSPGGAPDPTPGAPTSSGPARGRSPRRRRSTTSSRCCSRELDGPRAGLRGRGRQGRSSTSRRRPTTTATRTPASLGGEIQGRLTMRDVILVNEDSKVKAKVKNPQSGHLLEPVHAEHLRDRRPGDPRLDRRSTPPSRRARARRR